MQGIQPLAVVSHFGLVAIENLKDLRLISLRIGFDLFAGHRRARHVAARGITDHCRRVADQKNGCVTQILEVLHLSQQHRMAQMQVGRRRIEARLHAKRPSVAPALLQAFTQIFFADQFREPFFDVGELLIDGQRRHPTILGGASAARRPPLDCRREPAFYERRANASSRGSVPLPLACPMFSLPNTCSAATSIWLRKPVAQRYRSRCPSSRAASRTVPGCPRYPASASLPAAKCPQKPRANGTTKGSPHAKGHRSALSRCVPPVPRPLHPRRPA